jgi:hypothetical protein
MWTLKNHNIRKKILIVQTSPMHTGSTLLVNILHGLFESQKDKKIIFKFQSDNTWEPNAGEITILKSHDLDIDGWMDKYSSKYKIYFVCSERPLKNLLIEPKYKSYKNVISFYYNELNATPQNPLLKIVRKVGRSVFAMLKDCPNLTVNVANGIKRILDMNVKYEEIKDLPFSYIDPFFEIHGSHRGREGG